MYFIKTPWLLKKMYPNLTWNMNRHEKVLYLTFDDGPHPTATPFVLEQLQSYNAKATFFCIGKNVQKHAALYQQIIAAGHNVGNHTQQHLNGWKTNNGKYLQDIQEAQMHIDSSLFRPPYGRIKKAQADALIKNNPQFKIIMWDVLSGDFDTTISGEECYFNVIKNVKEGSIIVFHDSTKAWDRMHVALPKVLQYFSEKDFVFKAL
jgi:peptidoglycan/xylan/chitin deacetylase (PgdA/CDA1 family)